jgi:hypothetical protein
LSELNARVVAVHHKHAMELVGAGLGEDFDAPVAQLVVLRRKGILVDADFADRRFWRKLAAGESIDIDLPAVRSSRRTGQRIQFVLQLVGIVGKRIQVVRVCVLELSEQGVGGPAVTNVEGV